MPIRSRETGRARRGSRRVIEAAPARVRLVFVCVLLLVVTVAAFFAGVFFGPSIRGVSTRNSQPFASVNPRDSLFYIPFSNIVNRSEGGRQAGNLILAFLQDGNRAHLEQARALYEDLKTSENFGGEYPSLDWFCEYTLASEAQRSGLLADADARRFVDFFSPDGWALLSRYIQVKYGLVPPDDGERFRFVDELLRFNSPGREDWEKSDRILEVLGLRAGDSIADVGAGAGFFAFRFSDIVGDKGRVFAVELNPLDLDYIREIAAREGRTNIIPIRTEGTDIGAPDGSLDRIFLCSTYQAIYASVREPERSLFNENMLRALKDDGLLVISENDPVDRTGNPYRGISIGREVVIGQLEAYGFELAGDYRFIPQRYILAFRKRRQ